MRRLAAEAHGGGRSLLLTSFAAATSRRPVARAALRRHQSAVGLPRLAAGDVF